MNQFKAILFDCDGVLVDSEPVSMRALDVFLARYGKACAPDWGHRMVGRRAYDNAQMMVDSFDLPLSVEQTIAEHRQLIFELVEREAEAMPYADQLIRWLNQQHIPIAVATSSPRPYLTMVLQKFGWNDCFGATVTGEEVANGKPAPDIFLRAAELLGVTAQASLVLEDAPHGVQAGLAAEATVYAVPNSVTKYLEFPPVAKYASLAEVLAELQTNR
ncbi:HAD family hydrolase [Herpetosiphon llansteffanensis]|uniref:HAD family hydrolase n=1 Tax=Herpetosiphon llansteffanensis TaxID=2094568 RepID=UPI000D7BE63B|nr:HAD family phosphatase [Herpetosiphon llansteffanensis]